MEWSDEVITQLRGLWTDGHSTAEIGRRLGVTKNAIVGKAHRLVLSARPSPIRRDPNGPPARERRPALHRIEGPTLPPLPSTCGTAMEPTFVALVPPAPVAMAPPATAVPEVPRVEAAPPTPPRPVMPRPQIVVAPQPRPAVAPPPRAVAQVPRPYGRVVTCCWPLGEPGTRDFRFCDTPSEPGRPYCEDHVKVAYVKVRDRREDAA